MRSAERAERADSGTWDVAAARSWGGGADDGEASDMTERDELPPGWGIRKRPKNHPWPWFVWSKASVVTLKGKTKAAAIRAAWRIHDAEKGKKDA